MELKGVHPLLLDHLHDNTGKEQENLELPPFLAKIGIPATYCGITALVITLLASQIGVCD